MTVPDCKISETMIPIVPIYKLTVHISSIKDDWFSCNLISDKHTQTAMFYFKLCINLLD